MRYFHLIKFYYTLFYILRYIWYVYLVWTLLEADIRDSFIVGSLSFLYFISLGLGWFDCYDSHTMKDRQTQVQPD